MTAVPLLEAEQAFRIARRRACATEVLAKTRQVASPFIVVVHVLCGAASLAFLATSTNLDTRALVGAAAGGALALAALAYGELRRLRRRLDALETLALGDAA